MASAGSSNGSAPPVRKPPVVQPSGFGNTIVIKPVQRGNPILEHIRNVGKEFGDIEPDYVVGKTTCAIYLSLKYHRLHPTYIHQRIEKLGRGTYNLRLLLLLCDVKEHQDPIRELTKICLINDMTIIVAWTPEEAGMYLSAFKAFERKPPDLIKERVEKDHRSILTAALTSIPKVNKTDVETLRTNFGSFARISAAPAEQLNQLPGVGQVKVKRIKDAFEQPFHPATASRIDDVFKPPSLSQAEPTAADDAYAAPPSAVSEPATTGDENAIPKGKNAATTRYSPEWNDLDLDLNGSDDSIGEPDPKRRKQDVQ